MNRSLALVLLTSLTLVGCASSAPMEGGMLDDHATDAYEVRSRKLYLLLSEGNLWRSCRPSRGGPGP